MNHYEHNDSEKNKDVLNDDTQLTGLLKKARRKTVFRNVAISLISSLLVISAVTITNATLLSVSSEHALTDISMFKEISGPNLYITGYTQNEGFLKGTLEYQTYKIVEGIPVVWSREIVDYNVLGHFSRFPGSYAPIQIPDPTIAKDKFDFYRSYNNQSGQREMLFFQPTLQYKAYLNDLPVLNQMDNRKAVEMGISFDKPYSVVQIKSMLPKDVHPVWYWVDTYYDKDTYQPHTVLVDKKMPDGTVKKENIITKTSPELASQVYGFGMSPENGDVTEKTFLQDIDDGVKRNGKYQDEYQKIFDYIRNGKAQPTENDVKILGVVVTGSTDSLKALQGQDYVKAAVLGSTVDKY